MPFACSICEQESTRICVYCTKDACSNHLCERCNRCSDCCECDIAVQEQPLEAPTVRAATPPAPAPEPEPFPDPEPEPQEPDPNPVVQHTGGGPEVRNLP
jgi:hypothetical protein